MRSQRDYLSIISDCKWFAATNTNTMQIYYVDIKSESLDSFIKAGWELLSVNDAGIAIMSKAGLTEPFTARKAAKL